MLVLIHFLILRLLCDWLISDQTVGRRRMSPISTVKECLHSASISPNRYFNVFQCLNFAFLNKPFNSSLSFLFPGSKKIWSVSSAPRIIGSHFGFEVSSPPWKRVFWGRANCGTCWIVCYMNRQRSRYLANIRKFLHCEEIKKLSKMMLLLCDIVKWFGAPLCPSCSSFFIIFFIIHTHKWHNTLGEFFRPSG